MRAVWAHGSRAVPGKVEHAVRDIDLMESPTDMAHAHWQQAIETFREQIRLLVQWATLMALANVTLVGYATAKRLATLVALGAAFPLSGLGMLTRFKRHAQPIVYTAVRIEVAERDRGLDPLATTYVSQIAGFAYLADLQDAASRPDFEQRMSRLRTIQLPSFFGRRFLPPLLVLAGTAQVAAGVWLGSHARWSYF